MFGTVVVSALRVWPVDTSAGCSIRGSSPWETQRSNKSPHNHPLGLTLFIPLLACLPYCELKLVWSTTKEAWEIFHSRSQIVTFHFRDPRPLLRDYFDVPYLSLSANNSKCHQTVALGWNSINLIFVWTESHSYPLFHQLEPGSSADASSKLVANLLRTSSLFHGQSRLESHVMTLLYMSVYISDSDSLLLSCIFTNWSVGQLSVIED